MEYKGVLVSVDSFMNLLLASTEEYVDGLRTGELGEVLVRCNNVMYIRSLSLASSSPSATAEPAADVDMVEA